MFLNDIINILVSCSTSPPLWSPVIDLMGSEFGDVQFGPAGMMEQPGSEKILEADLILLALGFLGAIAVDLGRSRSTCWTCSRLTGDPFGKRDHILG